MTVLLPLQEDQNSFNNGNPSFLKSSCQPSEDISRVVKAVVKARSIAVVCGAGISVGAGIPDFRSSDGLFQSLKRDNPFLSSGKDLFDASVFNSEQTLSLFYRMIAHLSEISGTASPTLFHTLLRSLDDRRSLLRVYTQNIDALESKTGISFGVPEIEGKRYKPRSRGKGKAPALAADTGSDPVYTSRLPSPPPETPRCIPLHGTLKSLHCQTCTHSFPLTDHLSSLSAGVPPYCPECAALEETRQLVGKRSRGVGKLRPSVVLYNEDHKDGEEVGEVVRKDLMGNSKGRGRNGADLLLVVGTSLRVPGTKRIVREFSKAVRSRASSRNSAKVVDPGPSTRNEDSPIQTIYVNLDFPVPSREWEGVFDVWVKGDAQEFADLVHKELLKEKLAQQAIRDRKRKREEALRAVTKASTDSSAKPAPLKKCKTSSPTPVVVPLAPPSRRKVSPSSQSSNRQSPAVVTRKVNGEISIILRIPPRPPVSPIAIRTRAVPEVYITTPPPPGGRKYSKKLQLPPTPASTPSAQDVGRMAKSTSNSETRRPVEREVDRNDDVDSLPVLPRTLRRAQLGLRSTS
ncbi:DHS-like NAD/FAD-binding domain-containing protein [Dentipellis sp. KUC8613]|nr:DHS-like NAD/FAD-binding domain-containing protein [Dentipellis sp. KUC8613]